MKTIFKIALLVVLFSVASCRDSKKDDAAVKATEQIETIEVETDSLVNDLELEADELEKELKELENL
ncbi:MULTISPECIES: hypothetical protein [unclassified Olleya]|jgi:hypothetical protein|uniref:hypothetical protein n=1 Tax=unclassified Olleya TaxID=2615019 RepID=UPI0011AA5F03|nr:MULTISPECIES: hypothetical protein [unclassified Olleya]TVZ46102.1 hypothetical protein JM82_0670 [Olleya sp. Hel_I_94]|tara:strand:- start:1263 stop:1463 length:201 start_codon:yes stop_codon:yes gene_type:complete